MRTRLLTLAAVACLVPGATPAEAAAAPYTACTSLVGICPIACASDSMITVTVVGAGYGEARCGSGVTSCTSSSAAGTCTQQQYLDSGGSWLRCLADPTKLTPAVAICTTSPFVN